MPFTVSTEEDFNLQFDDKGSVKRMWRKILGAILLFLKVLDKGSIYVQ